MDLDKLRVNGQRLRSSLEAMAEIGATPGGGVQRLTLSLEDKQARDLLVSWVEQIGLDVSIDEMGNIFGRRHGKDDDLPPVMAGSHADTQPKGGRFDGILGVMGALEVLRTLEEQEIETRRPVMLVDWTNEEGSRFAPAMMASGVWAGKLERDRAWESTDVGGVVFGEELERIGYRGHTLCASWPFHAYFELHIEQGPVPRRASSLRAAMRTSSSSTRRRKRPSPPPRRCRTSTTHPMRACASRARCERSSAGENWLWTTVAGSARTARGDT